MCKSLSTWTSNLVCIYCGPPRLWLTKPDQLYSHPQYLKLWPTQSPMASKNLAGPVKFFCRILFLVSIFVSQEAVVSAHFLSFHCFRWTTCSMSMSLHKMWMKMRPQSHLGWTASWVFSLVKRVRKCSRPRHTCVYTVSLTLTSDLSRVTSVIMHPILKVSLLWRDQINEQQNDFYAANPIGWDMSSTRVLNVYGRMPW